MRLNSGYCRDPSLAHGEKMLPRSVREQAERADAAHQELMKTGNPAQTEPVDAPVEAIAPEPSKAPAPAPVEQPVTQALDSWELKYKVLQGKYNAEVPALATRVRELERTSAATAPTPAPEPATGMTHAHVIATYGEDFTQAVETIAEAKTKPLRDELSSKVAEIDASTAARARESFIAELGRFVPSWGTVDRDPGFTAYLDDLDTQTGRTRREFFNEADADNNAARVASFFSTYSKGNSPAPTPVAAPASAPLPEPLISPDSSRQSDIPVGKKQWTVPEINAFYKDARAKSGNPTGRFTATEYARIESDINAAVQEGRIG